MKKNLLVGGLFVLAQFCIPVFAVGQIEGEIAKAPMSEMGMEQAVAPAVDGSDLLNTNAAINSGSSLIEDIGNSAIGGVGVNAVNMPSHEQIAAAAARLVGGASRTLPTDSSKVTAAMTTATDDAAPSSTRGQRYSMPATRPAALASGGSSQSPPNAGNAKGSSALRQLQRMIANLRADWSRPGSYGNLDAVYKVPTDGNGVQKTYKLGRVLPSRIDVRTLRFEHYLKDGLPPAPAQLDFGQAVDKLHESWQMLVNDRLGDCTIARVGHTIKQWLAFAKQSVINFTDKEIEGVYSDATGYDPNDPSTDQGAEMITIENYFRQKGIHGHKITAFLSVDPQNLDHVRKAFELTGNLALAVALPLSAQNQRVWDVPPEGPTGDGAPGSWGGHAINVSAYNNAKAAPATVNVQVVEMSQDGVKIITWGEEKWMTWDFFKAYVQEVYAEISDDFMNSGKTANLSLDMDTLMADLKQVTSDSISNSALKAVNYILNMTRGARNRVFKGSGSQK